MWKRKVRDFFLRDHETDPLVTFDHIVTSDSFVGSDKDLFYVGLFTSAEPSPSERLQQWMRLMGSPMALCIFRASDLSGMVTRTPLAVQMRNEPVRKLVETNRTFGDATDESLRFLRLNGSAGQLHSLQFISEERSFVFSPTSTRLFDSPLDKIAGGGDGYD
ncbi:hypothetical protein TSMEX_005500 [Taenia solium]|eukprot:TsM_000608100 transcript=TsM_000608100 gene=TsM_000608100